MDTGILVVGAGPAGLTMANVLAAQDVPFRIIDKKAGPVEESRALVVHAKTLELLDRLGLADRAIGEGKRLGAVELRSEGRPAAKFSFEDEVTDWRTPYPFVLTYEQDRTERLLVGGLEEARGGIEWETELLSLEQVPGGVEAVVRRADGSEETIEARWAVGADGASSPVRHALGLGFEGATYEQTLFLADVDLESELGPQQACGDLTREGFLGIFPMPGSDQRFRLFGTLPEEMAAAKEITAAGIQEYLDRYSGLRVRLLRSRWTSVYRIHHRITERFRVGHVFLVGDAAHIHSPAGGQGMNTGIGDGFNLAWKLALVVDGHAREALLDSYAAERVPFARSILKGSDRGFHYQHTSNPVAQKLKLFTAPLLFRLVTELRPVRRRAFWLLSQLWTGYRDSPAVAQSGLVKKGPRAGDRAPYGFFEAGPHAGESIFDEIGDLDHHLLLFEGRRPDAKLPDVGRTEEDLRALLGSYEAPISVHTVHAGNRRLHERYGADSPTLFLVRPDGHVAYRGLARDSDGLESYLDGLFVGSERRVEQNVGARGAKRSVEA